MSKFTESFERGEGIYTISEVAFYAQMHTNTVRSWFNSRTRPTFRPGTSSVSSEYLSFVDLIEAIYVRKLRNKFHISFPVIRTAVDTARKLKGVQHPFAHPDFRTVVVGKEINIIERESQSTMVALAPNPGQLSDCTILQDFIDDLEFDGTHKIVKHIAFRSTSDRVIIAPDFNFGAPMLESCGYTAEVLWQANQSEGGRKQAADAYGVEEATIQAAVDYYGGIMDCGGFLKKAA